ncbi:MAG TPA: Asp23/Gls24 family envelope stress response protein [Thermoclostridium sp.]
MFEEKDKALNQTDNQEQPITTENEGLGEIRISSEVVSVIASNAAMEVKGVASFGGGIAGNISQVLGRKNPFKGIKVEIADNNEVNIDLHIVVEYGVRIPDVAWKLQERIKQNVESMTGLHVNEINVHVQGVSFEKESKKTEPEVVETEKDAK